MRDNKTSQAAVDYDRNANKTIRWYDFFHEEAIDLVATAKQKPEAWLDTGCGTGTLLCKAKEHFGAIHFVAADPSESMLAIARNKLTDTNIQYVLAGSEDLCYNETFDVVTAILAHHYLDSVVRRQATRNCFQALKPGGIYITFETIEPASEKGIEIGLKRWRLAQLKSGKSVEAVDKHLSRYKIELLPITIDEHIKLLKEIGFSTVNIFFVAGMQAGFYGIK